MYISEDKRLYIIDVEDDPGLRRFYGIELKELYSFTGVSSQRILDAELILLRDKLARNIRVLKNKYDLSEKAYRSLTYRDCIPVIYLDHPSSKDKFRKFNYTCCNDYFPDVEIGPIEKFSRFDLMIL